MANELHKLKAIKSIVTNDNDYDPIFATVQFHGDVTIKDGDLPPWHIWHEWTITNPPFNKALPILKNAWRCSANVAMLLRITYLEPTKQRAPLLSELADHQVALIPFGSPRPSFTEDGRTDAATVAWFVWQKDWSWKARDIPPPFRYLTNWKLNS